MVIGDRSIIWSRPLIRGSCNVAFLQRGVLPRTPLFPPDHLGLQLLRQRAYQSYHVSTKSTLHRYRSELSLNRHFHLSKRAERRTSGIAHSTISEPKTEPAESTQQLVQANTIQIIDYSDQRVLRTEVAEADLGSFLTSNNKPEWAACRWIYVNGLNPDIVRTIGNAKRLHRLALEDVLDTDTPSKVDWYETHCFMEMPLQKLVKVQYPTATDPGLGEPLQDGPRRRMLSRDLAISVEQFSLFLTADNTVITIFEHSGPIVLQPILTRLSSPQTMLRSTNDPWMLVHAVIDVVVDLSLPIGKSVAKVFGNLEEAVLSRPTIAQSKELYVLRSGLTVLMDNTNSIGGLVRTLCDHRDVPETQASKSIHISPVTQVYLQDVRDHIATLSSSTHISIRTAENLTALIFNTIAASQNESVRQLTLVSCFFLPITALTGYFGMNFDPMPVVNNHSDAYFWVIAAPVMLSTLMFLGIRSTWARSFMWKRRRGRDRTVTQTRS